MYKEEKTLERAAVEKIFAERKDFIIIGLTGRTGCGCTTVANLLRKGFSDLQPPTPITNGTIEEREYKTVYNYSERIWEPFQLIEMKHIIFTFILEHSFDETLNFIKDMFGDSFDLCRLEKRYQKLHEKRMQLKERVDRLTSVGESVPGDDEIYNYYFIEIPEFYHSFQEAIHKLSYTKLLQQIGDNIRSSGNAYSTEINPENILKLSQRVNMLIKILRRRNLKSKKQVLVVIDAFRNPYEATFFKDRYSSFYLLSINATEGERRNRLFKGDWTVESINDLDKREYPDRNNTINDFFQINIEKTIELADIHISNHDSPSMILADTKKQLVKYICLIMHPGLIPPTPIERCMQTAYDAKLNSGCLSRQVGAVITDQDFNLLASGWNCAPAEQIPCNLRSLLTLTRDDEEDLIGMSEFERNDSSFRDFLRKQVETIDFSTLEGRNCPYCFKDAYNAFKNKKNQVYTRSIHAEEMAFLQAGKIGSAPLSGGLLFTTASPCELCAKKAYHTKLSKIYYIDQYPGISYEHILNCGEKHPEMILYNGAIGRAYTQLYSQIMPYKDELYMMLSLTFQKRESNT